MKRIFFAILIALGGAIGMFAQEAQMVTRRDTVTESVRYEVNGKLMTKSELDAWSKDTVFSNFLERFKSLSSLPLDSLLKSHNVQTFSAEELEAAGINVRDYKNLRANLERLMDARRSDKPTTSAEFLTRFNNLRLEYAKLYANSDVDTRQKIEKQSAISSRIYELCKGYSSLLDKDERELCRLGVEDMRNSTVVLDNYQSQLLSLIIKTLK